MGYAEAKRDGVRMSGDWATRYYHPPCCLCGEEVHSWSYQSGVKYRCKSCRAIVAQAEKEQKRIENYQPAEKQLASAVKKIGKHVDISKYEKAIEKVAKEMHEKPYDSAVEIMVAIELSKQGIAYRHQVKLGSYRADFLLDDMKVVLEVDGVIYHSARTRQKEELRDGLILIALGAEWQIVRITDELVNENITKLKQAIEKVLQRRAMLRGKNGALPEWYTDRKTS